MKVMMHLDENEKVYWHDFFVEGLKLEFNQYGDALMHDSEHQLSKKPSG
jgi:hypothetical protein